MFGEASVDSEFFSLSLFSLLSSWKFDTAKFHAGVLLQFRDTFVMRGKGLYMEVYLLVLF